jgi:FlaA1/EpsC-like NDP-sugar epimerase
MPIIDAERKQARISPAMNNQILVTGGAGYIGSHACKAESGDMTVGGGEKMT